MRLLALLLMTGTFATGSAQASSILVAEENQSTQPSASMVVLQASAAPEAASSPTIAPLSHPTPSFDAAPNTEPFRLTRSMIAVGTPLPEASVAKDETTAAITLDRKRNVNLPPVLIRAGVRTEPAMHSVASPRKPAPKTAQAKPRPQGVAGDEEPDEESLPLTKPGSPL